MSAMPARGEPIRDDAAVARVVVPDLGIEGIVLTLSSWLVPEGSAVEEGERIVEILAGGVTVDIASPAAGELVRILVDEDDTVTPGTVVGEIETPRAVPRGGEA